MFRTLLQNFSHRGDEEDCAMNSSDTSLGFPIDSVDAVHMKSRIYNFQDKLELF